MPDQHGYPTEADLARIRDWPIFPEPPSISAQVVEWLDFIKTCWWAADWGWSEPEYLGRDKVYRFSTGGWSGNESIIDAMQQSILWSLFWYQSRRGGHYEFRIQQFGGDSMTFGAAPFER